jgi:hypothetical protein
MAFATSPASTSSPPRSRSRLVRSDPRANSCASTAARCHRRTGPALRSRAERRLRLMAAAPLPVRVRLPAAHSARRCRRFAPRRHQDRPPP